MTKETKDTCVKCGRKGLLKSEANGPKRRRCSLCHAENPCGNDRVLYLAVSCAIAWDHDDRRQQHRLGEWWSVEPFLEKAAAEKHLADVREWMEKRDPGHCVWRPITVGGIVGLHTSDHGHPIFHGVMEKLLNCSPIMAAGAAG